jgi:hypothetical protein
MIPMLAIVSFQRSESRKHRFWLPLILPWILLSPVLLLIFPFVIVGFLVVRVNPFRGVAAVWQFLTALRKTEIELGWQAAGFSICIL